MDEIAESYLRAGDLEASGNLDEAIAEYKAGLALFSPTTADAATRKTYFLVKLRNLLWRLQRYEEARPVFEMSGEKMPRIPSDNQPFRKAIKTLQKEGLLADLSKKEMTRILQELDLELEDADDELEPIDFLQVYYDSSEPGLSARAITDGFLHHDWRYGQETSDVVAEICQIIGKPVLKQIEYSSVQRQDVVGETVMLSVEFEDGKRETFPVDGLEDILAFVNKTLEKLGDARRFVSLETNGDWFAYYLFDQPKWKKIIGSKSPALSSDGIPGIDEKRWQKR
ncbi:MAG: hypothetical protein EKK48_04350 [Candidatus Melainabacteria bacterium]|nr:MAG: hypothetical protein EKK48_04350 [Candidatus Melainabacteria bacterium]